MTETRARALERIEAALPKLTAEQLAALVAYCEEILADREPEADR